MASHEAFNKYTHAMRMVELWRGEIPQMRVVQGASERILLSYVRAVDTYMDNVTNLLRELGVKFKEDENE